MKIKQIEYHRNGVGGTPFHAVLFTDEKANMLATVFPEQGEVAVICLDAIEKVGVTFGENSYRGDYYETRLRAAIAKQETERTLQPTKP